MTVSDHSLWHLRIGCPPLCMLVPVAGFLFVSLEEIITIVRAFLMFCARMVVVFLMLVCPLHLVFYLGKIDTTM